MVFDFGLFLFFILVTFFSVAVFCDLKIYMVYNSQ